MRSVILASTPTIRELPRSRHPHVVITGVSQFDLAKEALNARQWVRGTRLQLVPHTFSKRSSLLTLRLA